MTGTMRNIIQTIIFLTVSGVYCGEWCEATYSSGAVRKYCDVGGCCVPSEQRTYSEDTEFCCISLVFVILVCVFLGIPLIILIIVCCICCVKYYNRQKNKTREFSPRQDDQQHSYQRSNRYPKPNHLTTAHFIGPPSYESTSGYLPGTPDTRRVGRAPATPPPPYCANSIEDMTEQNLEPRSMSQVQPNRPKPGGERTRHMLTNAFIEHSSFPAGQSSAPSPLPMGMRSSWSSIETLNRESTELENNLEFI